MAANVLLACLRGAGARISARERPRAACRCSACCSWERGLVLGPVYVCLRPVFRCGDVGGLHSACTAVRLSFYLGRSLARHYHLCRLPFVAVRRRRWEGALRKPNLVDRFWDPDTGGLAVRVGASFACI